MIKALFLNLWRLLHFHTIVIITILDLDKLPAFVVNFGPFVGPGQFATSSGCWLIDCSVLPYPVIEAPEIRLLLTVGLVTSRVSLKQIFRVTVLGLSVLTLSFSTRVKGVFRAVQSWEWRDCVQ
jgi:hypothetical protein